MGIQRYEDLTPIQMDVLQEVGNIGSGNAAAALSNLISKNVEIEMANVKIVEFQEAIDQAGGAERVVAGVLSRMVGNIEGMILLFIDRNFINTVISSFSDKKVSNLLELREEEISALSEIGNIMGGAYVSAIGTLTGIEAALEAPILQVDMVGALMSLPVVEFGEIDDKILYIDKHLHIDGKEMNADLLMIPAIGSLAKIMEKLGLDS